MTHRFNWKRLSMSAAIAYRPDGSDAQVMFEIRTGSYNDEGLIAFLEGLRGHLDAKVTLVWDGLPSHRSKCMNDWIKSQRRWLVVERLPAYAPDLNPVEALWGNLKGTELANRCVDTIDDAADIAEAGLARLAGDSDLCFSFLRRSGLCL